MKQILSCNAMVHRRVSTQPNRVGILTSLQSLISSPFAYLYFFFSYLFWFPFLTYRWQ